MSFAKGFLLGSLGCFAGCLVAAVALVLVLAVGFAGCVTALPLALGVAAAEGVELEFDADAPADAADLLLAEIRSQSGGHGASHVRIALRDGRHLWLVLGRERGERRADAQGRAERALQALERRGALPKGSVRIRNVFCGERGGLTIDFGDTAPQSSLPSKPSNR